MTDRVPAEAFPPGEFLRDELEARGWTQTEFAEIIQRPLRLVNEIIAGKRGVSPDTARALAAALGTSAQLWMNLETTYQLAKAQPASEGIARAARLRERFPVREMIKRGWIETSENVAVLEKRVLDFFGLETVDADIQFAHAPRKNEREEKADIQLAWLFRVRQLARALQVPDYSRKALLGAIDELEQLMTEPEEIRHVPRVLAEAGVRLVIVEAVPGSEIQGVCFWINEGKSPVIGLSLSYGRIDNAWFNIRHEIEHVLNGDGKEHPILDDADALSGARDQSEEEKLANNAAANFCVPKEKMDSFIARLDPMYSTTSFLGFARLVQRHPGIVAGQLQKRTGRWDLFRKYQIDIRTHLVDAALTDGFGRAVPMVI